MPAVTMGPGEKYGFGTQSLGNALSGAGSFSVYLRINPNDVGGGAANDNQILAIVINSATTYGLVINIEGTGSNRMRIGGRTAQADSFQSWFSSSTVGTGSWQNWFFHIAYSTSSAGTVTMHLGTTSEHSTTTADWSAATYQNDGTPTNTDGISSQALDTNDAYDGDIARAVVWKDHQLTAKQRAAIDAGWDPAQIAPGSIIFDPAFVGTGNIYDPHLDATGTLSGTVTQVGDHFPLVLARRHQSFWATTAASGVSVSVPLATAIALTGQVPTVSTGVNVSAPAGSITVAGQVPIVGTGVINSVPVATIDITGLAPTITTAGPTIAVPVANIVMAGQIPTISASEGVTISPPVARMRMTGFAPVYEAGSLLTLVTNTKYEVYVKGGNDVWEHTEIIFTGTDFGSPSC